MKFLQRSAGLLAESFVFRKGKKKWAENEKNWNLPLTQWEKLLTGGYIILKDYSTGHFPPTFPDQQRAYENEIEIRNILPGMDAAAVKDANLRKPFWNTKLLDLYFTSFLQLVNGLRRVNVNPPAKILELGCGSGWTSDFLAHLGYDVVGTTISPYEVEDGRLRVESMRAKHLNPTLQFIATPMEDVYEATRELGPFDAVFVHEALHHAYEWQAACRSTFKCLKPGGWFLLCNEPNVLHTFISYRIARMASTHEIGFKKGEVVRVLRECGFENMTPLKARFGFYYRPFWLAAQRPLEPERPGTEAGSLTEQSSAAHS